MTVEADGTPHALILSGAGRYADPWHPFEQTSAQLAGILKTSGFQVEIDSRVDERMSNLGEPDLLVVNIGNPAAPDQGRDLSTRRGLLRYLESGRPLLAIHVSATSLTAVPEWEDILGGIWVRGTTMHPDYGNAEVHIAPTEHPIIDGLHNFTTLDERYTHLRTARDIVTLATHSHEGSEHPLLWTNNYGSSRVVYDALGHDDRSYESPEHREIIARAARWLIGGLRFDLAD